MGERMINCCCSSCGELRHTPQRTDVHRALDDTKHALKLVRREREEAISALRQAEFKYTYGAAVPWRPPVRGARPIDTLTIKDLQVKLEEAEASRDHLAGRLRVIKVVVGDTKEGGLW